MPRKVAFEQIVRNRDSTGNHPSSCVNRAFYGSAKSLDSVQHEQFAKKRIEQIPKRKISQSSILKDWVFSWECPWARHFRAQPSTGETQERHE